MKRICILLLAALALAAAWRAKPRSAQALQPPSALPVTVRRADPGDDVQAWLQLMDRVPDPAPAPVTVSVRQH